MAIDIKIKEPGPGAEEIASKIRLEMEKTAAAGTDAAAYRLFADEALAPSDGVSGEAPSPERVPDGKNGGISGFAFKHKEFIKKIPVFGKVARGIYRLNRNKERMGVSTAAKYLVRVIYKIPVLNYFARTAVFILTVPKKVKWIERIEAEASAERDRLAAELSKKADAGRVYAELVSLSSALSKKADAVTEERLFEEMRAGLASLSSSLAEKADAVTEERLFEEMRAGLASLSSALSEKADKKVPEKLESFYTEDAPGYLDTAVEKFYSPVKDFEKFKKEELYYSLFEQVFYDHDAVMEKQKVYLDYIPAVNSAELPHLDAGCGRGEFLSILKENGFNAVGVDVNGIETEKLKRDGFSVTKSDIIAFLKGTGSLFSSISALQVIEHLNYAELKQFLELSYERLSKDGAIILETLNPLCLFTFSAFYMDDTHKRPIPPDYIIFLMQWTGFKNIKIVYSFPMPENKRFEDKARNYHDYAVIGRKI